MTSRVSGLGRWGAAAAVLGFAAAAGAAPIAPSMLAERTPSSLAEVLESGTLQIVPARGVRTSDAVLAAALSRLHCASIQPQQGEALREAAGYGDRDGVSEAERAEWFDPPPRPELYTAGIAPAKLRALAGEIVGTDASGRLDGSRADHTGIPPAVAVSGYGSRRAPRIVFVPAQETPVDLGRDATGAGILVVAGDLRVWNRFGYKGMVLVLGSLAVMEGGSLRIEGLPLFGETLAVFHRGNLSLQASDEGTEITRRLLGRRVKRVSIPLPTIERTQAPVEEPDCEL